MVDDGWMTDGWMGGQNKIKSTWKGQRTFHKGHRKQT